MPRNYYSEINLHIVWHTKTSSPLLTPTVEPDAHCCLKQRIIDTAGGVAGRLRRGQFRNQGISIG
jgi:argininosuccinate lyase